MNSSKTHTLRFLLVVNMFIYSAGFTLSNAILPHSMPHSFTSCNPRLHLSCPATSDTTSDATSDADDMNTNSDVPASSRKARLDARRAEKARKEALNSNKKPNKKPNKKQQQINAVEGDGKTSKR